MKVTNLLELEREKRALRQAVFVERLGVHTRHHEHDGDTALLEAVRRAEHDADLVVAEYFRDPECAPEAGGVAHELLLRGNEFIGTPCGLAEVGDRIATSRERVTCRASLDVVAR